MTFIFGKASGTAECREHGRDMAEAFAGTEPPFEEWAAKVGPDNIRCLYKDGTRVAGLIRLEFGQYFGGSNIPAVGIAGVVVPPIHRGKHNGHELMLCALQEMHADGVALSPLYAAAPALYQNLGWALAGSHGRWRIALSDVAVDASIADTQVWDGGFSTLKNVYDDLAQDNSGWLARSDAIWSRILRVPADGNPLKVYLATESDEVTGYVVFQHHRNAQSTHFWLQLKDFQFKSRAAGNALLALLKSFSSVSKDLLFTRGSDDPIFAFMIPQAQHLDFSFNWYQRIVHVKNALEGRGYSRTASGSVTLRIIDSILPANDGAIKLAVDGGCAAVEGVDKASIELDVAGLAMLYCGRHSPAHLRQLGLLRGDDNKDETLATLFAGPQPSLPDFF